MAWSININILFSLHFFVRLWVCHSYVCGTFLKYTHMRRKIITKMKPQEIRDSCNHFSTTFYYVLTLMCPTLRPTFFFYANCGYCLWCKEKYLNCHLYPGEILKLYDNSTTTDEYEFELATFISTLRNLFFNVQ